jgi:hypothetical protein
MLEGNILTDTEIRHLISNHKQTDEQDPEY